jgi:N6-adenosine-specific RNA methylase IME4
LQKLERERDEARAELHASVLELNQRRQKERDLTRRNRELEDDYNEALEQLKEFERLKHERDEAIALASQWQARATELEAEIAKLRNQPQSEPPAPEPVPEANDNPPAVEPEPKAASPEPSESDPSDDFYPDPLRFRLDDVSFFDFDIMRESFQKAKAVLTGRRLAILRGPGRSSNDVMRATILRAEFLLRCEQAGIRSPDVHDIVRAGDDEWWLDIAAEAEPAEILKAWKAEPWGPDDDPPAAAAPPVSEPEPESDDPVTGNDYEDDDEEGDAPEEQSKSSFESKPRVFRKMPILASFCGREVPLPMQLYEVVAADFPWFYWGDRGRMGTAGKYYPLMPDEEVLAFPMRSLMMERAMLFLWATSPRLNFAMDCIRNWGLFYRGVSFDWIKTRKDGWPIRAQGVRPSITKSTSELVLGASTVEFGRPLPVHDESVEQVVLAPKRGHSVKPIEVYRRIERLYPNVSKLELFARRPRAGWDTWGNECWDYDPAWDDMRGLTPPEYSAFVESGRQRDGYENSQT